MKKTMLMMLVLFPFISVAQASTEVFVTNLAFNTYRGNASYGVYAPLNRAWLEVSVDSNCGEGCPQFDTQKFQVPGLSYDAATAAIVYQKGDQKTVCAYAKRGFLGITRILTTGDCWTGTKTGSTTYDDGFGGVATQATTQLYFYAN